MVPLGDPGPCRRRHVREHVLGRHELADHVLKEEERAVVDGRQARPEAPREAQLVVLVADGVLDLLPLDAEGLIGEHVVEALAHEVVLGEAVAELDVRRLLALDDQAAARTERLSVPTP